MKLQESLEDITSHLSRIDEATFDRLDFDWEGINFKAASTEKEQGQYIIQLNAKLGRLFYTVENATERAIAIEKVYATNKGIDGAYRIDHKGHIYFESVTTTDDKVTGADLISALTLILLESETHLRSLRAHLKSLSG